MVAGAKRLGLTPMSLYRYIASQDDPGASPGKSRGDLIEDVSDIAVRAAAKARTVAERVLRQARTWTSH